MLVKLFCAWCGTALMMALFVFPWFGTLLGENLFILAVFGLAILLASIYLDIYRGHIRVKSKEPVVINNPSSFPDAPQAAHRGRQAVAQETLQV